MALRSAFDRVGNCHDASPGTRAAWDLIQAAGPYRSNSWRNRATWSSSWMALLERPSKVRSQQAHLTKMLSGFYQYFGLYFCWQAVNGVCWRTRKAWREALQRRSQKAKRRCDWATLDKQAWFQ
jgi:RNA-directed DNA polymerase